MSRARDFADLAGAADAGGITGRNVVVNGSFAVSQRGTSFSAPNGTYTLDRMRCAQANSADTISQQTFTAGQTDVPGSPKNFLRFAFGAATANRVLETRIEDVYIGAGQSITLSFYAKASAAHTSSIEMTQSFGSGGSSAVAFGTQSYDITTSWQRFEFTLSCPSISGKTIGAGNYLSAAFIRSLSAGPSINVDIALLQLEVGQATPFEHEPFGVTLQKAMRYYEKGYDYDTAPGTTASYPGNLPFTVRGMDEETSGQRYMVFNLKSEKRAIPTNTYYDEQGNTGKVTTYDSGGTGTHNVSIGLVVNQRSKYGCGPGNSAIWGFGFFYECDAEL
jgi:hypothetical protein